MVLPRFVTVQPDDAVETPTPLEHSAMPTHRRGPIHEQSLEAETRLLQLAAVELRAAELDCHKCLGGTLENGSLTLRTTCELVGELLVWSDLVNSQLVV